MNNRIIKFRVWDGGQFWYDVAIMNNEPYVMNFEETGLVPLFTDDQIRLHGEPVIQQFTGFLDENGREIYEGDIVNYDCPSKMDQELYEKLMVSEVVFDEDRWRIKYSADYYFWNRMEVIGNIFENPELIEK